jgi:hypothetical protein
MPEEATKVVSKMRKLINLLYAPIKKSLSAERQTYANIFMLSFILFTSIGAALISPALGFGIAGVACGIFGFLLGLE